MKQQIVDMIVTQVAPIVIAGLAAVLGWLGKKSGDLITNLVKNSRTQRDDYYAGIAVKFAEDKFGPDTQKGREKLIEAAMMINKLSNGRIPLDKAETLARAAYVDFVNALKPLKNG